MALPHRSVATFDNVEFLDLQPLDINPLMSKCQIKVLYVGENRNNSYINKETATEMAKTLRGCPIVGYYKTEKEDFADHGHSVTIDDEGFHFETKTVPYGFVAPDATVWFQDFTDEDDFGNEVTRTYLVTTGFLWTGQFEEAKLPLEDEGRPQSMELDEASLKGHWAENSKNGLEFFIISDAVFSKLCILGEDVEPCYEGAAVTTPQTDFTNADDNKDFTKTLSQMMTQLQFALQNNAKGDNMENSQAQEEQLNATQTPENATAVEPATDSSLAAEQPAEQVAEATEPAEAPASTEPAQDFEKKEDEGKEEEEKNDKEDEEEEKKEDKKDYALEFEALKKELDELKTSFAALKEENNELSNFKANVETQAKQDMISKEFYMLSDEDKADVVAHMSEYSLDEIKSKLALICFEKKVTFGKEEEAPAQENQTPALTFNLNNSDADSAIPDWVKAVQENTH